MSKPTTIPCEEKQRVIIRVWTSSYNKTTPGTGDVGHISLEVENPHDGITNYMSLWPEGEPHKNPLIALFENRPSSFHTSYAEDKRAESNKNPQVVLCLYSLNTKAMVNKFKKMQAKTKHWTLFGDNILLCKGDKHSCASLAYKILEAGGIYRLISNAYSSAYSSAISPDRLVHAVKEAKRKELDKHAVTKNFHYTGQKETSEKGEPPFWCKKSVVIATAVAATATIALASSQVTDESPGCNLM